MPKKNKLIIWLFNIAMENGRFIDGLPIKKIKIKIIFHGELLNNQMVHWVYIEFPNLIHIIYVYIYTIYTYRTCRLPIPRTQPCAALAIHHVTPDLDIAQRSTGRPVHQGTIPKLLMAAGFPCWSAVSMKNTWYFTPLVLPWTSMVKLGIAHVHYRLRPAATLQFDLKA